MKTLLSLVFMLTFAAQVARADDVLEIPDECGSQSELTREVAALRASSRSTLPGERPDVQLTRDGTGYLLSVELPDGRRMLRDPDCRALFRAAIVIAALGHESSVENVLQASEASGTEPPNTKPSASAKPAEKRAENSLMRHEQEPRKSVVREPKADAEPKRSRRAPFMYPRRLSARALLSAGLGYGLLPGVNGIFGAGIALEYARFSARTLFAYQGPPRTETSGKEGVRVDALSASLTVELVALPWLRPGIGVDFAAMHGRGIGGSSRRSAWASQPMLHLSLCARLLARGPFSLELSARALWAPEPAKFTMQGREPVYTAPPWGVAGGISAGYQFL